MRKIKVTAWACVGSHGHIFATDMSPNPAMVGRFEIYKTYQDALNNAISKEYVVEVLITNIQAGDRD